MADLPNLLAGNSNLGSWNPVHVFSGDATLHSDGAAVGAAFPIYSVIGRNATTGLLYPHNPSATDGTEVALFVAAQAGVVGKMCPYYTAGQFNPDALVWNAATNTLALRQAAFQGTPVMIKAIY